MNLSDNLFKKVENKTKVDKDTIVSLANKLQKNNLKDETTLREVIRELSNMTGKSVSKEQENKIIDTIVKDNVPKNMDKFINDNLN
ncbi:MAG TPA: stage VI sporulation protein F [Mollicutes bacterium]|jgi:TPP-dependent pyruvate/acetoin dehydrogenase alpha subunit|nr:stage VI sporulation protein F [Mollicutes bacterium]